MFLSVAHQTAQQPAHWPKDNSPITWAGGLLSKIHVKFYVNWQEFSSMASDWLAAVLPANQMPSLLIFVTTMDFNMEIY